MALWPEIAEMMQSGKYDLSALVTHEFPVDQITEALILRALSRRYTAELPSAANALG